MFEENPKLKGKGPRCDVCFPGVDLGNMDAWEVFQRYANPFGVDSGTILTLCREMEIRDPLNTLEKVLDLLEAIESG